MELPSQEAETSGAALEGSEDDGIFFYQEGVVGRSGSLFGLGDSAPSEGSTLGETNNDDPGGGGDGVFDWHAVLAHRWPFCWLLVCGSVCGLVLVVCECVCPVWFAPRQA